MLFGNNKFILNQNRILTGNETLLISKPFWPLGWTHLTFLIQIKVNQNTLTESLVPNNKAITFELISIQKNKRNKLFKSKDEKIRIQIVFKLKNNNAIKYYFKYNNLGVKYSDRKIKELIAIINSFLLENLTIESNLYKSRNIEVMNYSKASKLVNNAKKKIYLDKVINPNKYKIKSPTVRKSKSSGAGRYTPSAAAKARRQSKSK
jgi:hypothetical protein